MAINTKVFTLDSGSVKIDNGNFSAEFSNAVLTTSVNEGDQRTMINGSVVQGDTTYVHKFKGTVEQNLTITGFAGYAMKNKGEIKDFEFKPHSADGALITGKVRIDPVDIGGDGGKINTSSVELSIIGDITFNPATKVGGVA